MQFFRQLIRPGGLAALALLPLILAGCGGGGGGNNGSGGTGGIGTGGNNGGGGGNGAPTSVSVVQPDGLTATLAENASAVGVGGTITYTLTLTNTTGTAVPINYSASAPTVPAAGLVVRDAAGNPIFQPIPGFPPLESTTLAPGQSQTTTQAATGFSAAGTYYATATFTDANSPDAALDKPTTVGPLAVVAK